MVENPLGSGNINNNPTMEDKPESQKPLYARKSVKDLTGKLGQEFELSVSTIVKANPGLTKALLIESRNSMLNKHIPILLVNAAFKGMADISESQLIEKGELPGSQLRESRVAKATPVYRQNTQLKTRTSEVIKAVEK